MFWRWQVAFPCAPAISAPQPPMNLERPFPSDDGRGLPCWVPLIRIPSPSRAGKVAVAFWARSRWARRNEMSERRCSAMSVNLEGGLARKARATRGCECRSRTKPTFWMRLREVDGRRVQILFSSKPRARWWIREQRFRRGLTEMPKAGAEGLLRCSLRHVGRVSHPLQQRAFDRASQVGGRDIVPSLRLFLGPVRMAATWLILPVVICLSQRLSHACLSINYFVL